MDYDSYLSPFSLRFFLIFKELLIITFSYNLQLILFLVSDCISVPKLFPLFPSAEPCGIRLTDSSLMLPIKSVSGVIGLGDGVRKLEYTCGLCTYDKCYRRKQRG